MHAGDMIWDHESSAPRVFRWSLVASGVAAWFATLSALFIGLMTGFFAVLVSDALAGHPVDRAVVESWAMQPVLVRFTNWIAFVALAVVAGRAGRQAPRLRTLHASAIFLIGLGVEALSSGSQAMLSLIVAGDGFGATGIRAAIVLGVLGVFGWLERRRNASALPSFDGKATGSDPALVVFGAEGLAGDPSRSPLRDFVGNLRAGAHLAFFRPVAADRFHVSIDQVACLVAFGLLCQIGWEWLVTDAPVVLAPTGLAIHAAWLLITFGFAWIVGREEPDRTAVLRILVMLLSTIPIAWIGFAVLDRVTAHSEWVSDRISELYWGTLFAIWLAPISVHVLGHATRQVRPQRLVLGLVYALAVYQGLDRWPSAFLLFTEAPAEKPSAGPPPLDAETILHEQPSRLAAALAELSDQRPGITDLYVVSFGADSSQDLFRKESDYVRDLFDRRFGTEARSLLLVNHRSTLDEHPIASRSNLRDALLGLGARIDRDEDIVVVYLTGHGTRSHELYVRFPGLPLNRFGPEELDAMLDDAGIRHRVVIVSACYSGGYVERLADPDTLVISSSASDRTSFGCSDDSDLTYFARAYFEQGLETDVDLIDVFDGAKERIAAREKEQALRPSLPQMSVGERIEPRLRALWPRRS